MYNLIILAGVPGCGKSTWARRFFDMKYAVVSSDKIRKGLAGTLKEAHGQRIKPWDVFYRKIDEHLKHGVDVIADATFLTKRHRKRVAQIAWDNNSKCHLVLFKNVMEATIRNAQRDDDARVPESVMQDMVRLYWDSLYEIPNEGYDTITKVESFV